MKHHRIIFILLFLFTLVSGAARKWIFTANSSGQLILLIQLLLPLAFLFAARSLGCSSYRPPVKALKHYLILLLFPALNPLNLTLAHGLAGLAIHSVFWIIVFTRPLNPDPGRFSCFNLLFILAGLLETVLACIQYRSPGDDFLNRYAIVIPGGDQSAALVGDSTRPAGTFSYISGLAAFNGFWAFFCCYLLKTLPGKPVTWLSILAGALNCILNGSRGTAAFFFTLIPFFIFLELGTDAKKVILKVVTAIALAALLNSLLHDPLKIRSTLSVVTGNFMERSLHQPGELASRIGNDLLEPLGRPFDFWLTGIGLGSTYQGATALLGRSPLLNAVPFEGELFRSVIEGGFLLLLARFYLLALCLASSGFQKS